MEHEHGEEVCLSAMCNVSAAVAMSNLGWVITKKSLGFSPKCRGGSFLRGPRSRSEMDVGVCASRYCNAQVRCLTDHAKQFEQSAPRRKS